MELNLKSQDGMTLQTEKKYCTENITVVPILQSKETSFLPTDQSITPDAGYAGLKEVKVAAIPDFDKYARLDVEQTFTAPQTFSEAAVTSAPTKDTDVIRKYEHDNQYNVIMSYVDEKVDKIINPDGTHVYGTDEGTSTTFPLNSDATADVVVRRAGTQINLPNQVQDVPTVDQAISSRFADNKYLAKAGGTITGNLAITGDLTVSGTTTTEKQEQLLVKDNVIATNADKADLKTLLSGLAINKNPAATYGIMYDPTDDAVKFGEGTLSADNKFVFKEGEGHPLAIRSDSTNMKNNSVVYWNSDKHRLETADFRYNRVAVTDKSNDFTSPYDSFNRIFLKDPPLADNDAARLFDTTQTIDLAGETLLPDEYQAKLSVQPWKFYIYENDIIYRYVTTRSDGIIAVYQAWINTETDSVVVDYKELAINLESFKISRAEANFNIPVTDHNNDFTGTQTFENAKVTKTPVADTDVTRLKDLEPIYITLTGVYEGKLTADELAKVIKYPDRVILINQPSLTNTFWFTFNGYYKDTNRNKEYYVFSQCRIAEDYDYTLTFLTVTSTGGWYKYNSANLALRNGTNIFNYRQQFNSGISAHGISYIESIKKNTNDSSILVPLPFVTNKSDYSPTEPKRYVIKNGEYIIFQKASYSVTFTPPEEVPYNYKAIFIIDKPYMSSPIFERIDFIDGNPAITSNSYFIFELTYKSSTEAIARQIYPSVSTKSNVAIGSATTFTDLKKIVYTLGADIPVTPESDVEYADTDFIGYNDLDSNLQSKIDDAITMDSLKAGDGIAIEANTSGGVEVKVDPNKKYLSIDDISAGIAYKNTDTNEWYAISYTPEATPNRLVQRDANGDFEARRIAISTPSDLNQCARIMEVGEVVSIGAPTGTLSPSQLQAINRYICTLNGGGNNNTWILFNNERYYQMSFGHQDGYRTYANVEYENNNLTIKTITVNLKTGAWVLDTFTPTPKLFMHVITPVGAGFSLIDYTPIPTPYTPDEMSKPYYHVCGYYAAGAMGPIVSPVNVDYDPSLPGLGFTFQYLTIDSGNYMKVEGSELVDLANVTDTVTPL